MPSDLRSKESEDSPSRPKASIRTRLRHFTWAWLACMISTGALAIILAQTPFRFTGLQTLGKIVYLLDIVLFLSFTALIITRFILRPRALTKSLHNPQEALVFGTFWVSLALILNTTQAYGMPADGPWLVNVLEICFWLYAGVLLVVAVSQYTTLFVAERLKVSDVMPTWILPIYPFLVLEPLAGTLLASQPERAAIPMLIGGIMFQGLGWMVSIFMYVIYVIRLMSAELPEAVDETGNVHFCRTCSGCPEDHRTFSGIFHWLLAFWFFALSVVGMLEGVKRMKFTLNWWALIFPNAGLTLAAIHISKALESDAIRAITSAITVLLAILWLFVAVSHIWAVWKSHILYPNIDEDAEMDT